MKKKTHMYTYTSQTRWLWHNHISPHLHSVYHLLWPTGILNSSGSQSIWEVLYGNLGSILNFFPIKLDLANLANLGFPHPSRKTLSISCSVMFDSLWSHGLWPTRLLCPRNTQGKNTGVDSHSILQGILLTQGSNLGLLHYRQILYHLSHQGIWLR